MLKKILFLTIVLKCIFQPILAETINVFDFTESELKKLKVKKVKGETKWSLGTNDKGNYIKAEADATGSGLGKEIKIDLIKTPFINITWKVEKDIPGIEENSKKGHDYAARVFVIKKTGSTALSNRAISYVFSSNNFINDNWHSPYTKKSYDYILSTTKNNLDEWVTVKANVRNHFKKFHNIDIQELSAVAIMTDTDNSKMKAVAYYQNIFFSSK